MESRCYRCMGKLPVGKWLLSNTWFIISNARLIYCDKRSYSHSSEGEYTDEDQSLPFGQLERPNNGNWQDQNYEIREDIKCSTSHIVPEGIYAFPWLFFIPEVADRPAEEPVAQPCREAEQGKEQNPEFDMHLKFGQHEDAVVK